VTGSCLVGEVIMARLSDDEILELRMDSDIGETTIRGWLGALLLRLWREGEGFSGKRPFGNSGWEHDAYRPLLAAGLISGKLDEHGYVEEIDDVEGAKIIERLIIRMGERRPQTPATPTASIELAT
jgi:hypothetical protein